MKHGDNMLFLLSWLSGVYWLRQVYGEFGSITKTPTMCAMDCFALHDCVLSLCVDGVSKVLLYIC